MVIKLTIVGRVSDGLPLAQGSRYVNEDNYGDLYSTYQQQGEFILSEISRGALSHSRMIIGINDDDDHHHLLLHCFSYIIENGICFMALTDSSYPRKLVFFFLQDLAKEFDKFDRRLIEKITKPYSFLKLGGIIGNIRRQYADTRTQANLSKLNAKCDQDTAHEIITEEFSQIVKRRNRYEMLQKLTQTSDHVPHFRDSKTFEVMALKWTPITILFIVAATLFWARLSIRNEFIMHGS